jgi:hypothetical protein
MAPGIGSIGDGVAKSDWLLVRLFNLDDFGFAAMPNRTGVRSDIHGVGDSGDSEKGSGGAELDFLDSVPICWGFYFGNSSSAHALFHDSGLYAC